jgi:hypothetical protein
LGRLTSGCGATEDAVGSRRDPGVAAHEHAGRRKACSHASRRGVTCRSRRAAAGKAGQAPTNSQSSPSRPASTLKSLVRRVPPSLTPKSDPIRVLERPGSRKWSRNDRVLPDDERHEPHAKEEPDVSAPPTRPHRNRRANTPMSDVKRECAQRLPNHTRTCNKLRPVNWLTN